MDPNDVIGAVFAVSGFQTYRSSMQQAIRLNEELAAAQELLATLTGKFGGGRNMAVFKDLQAAEASVAGITAELGEMSMLLGSGVIIAGLVGIAAATRSAVKEFTEFNTLVANIRDLTGGTDKESFGLANLGKVAGIADPTMLRDLVKMTKATFSNQGQAALAKLGVGANANVSGIAMVNQIRAALAQVPNGQRKTEIESQIFGGGGQGGARSISALQALLRLTQQQQDEITGLGNAFDAGGTRKAQEFTASIGILGQSFMVNIVNPLVSTVLPLFTMMASGITHVVNSLGWLNQQSHGVLAFVGVVVLLAGAFAGVVTAIVMAVEAIKSLTAAQWLLNAAQAVWDALTGPVGWASLAVAGVAVGAGAIAFANSGSDDSTDTPMDKFGDHVDRFGQSVARMEDSFSSARGPGIPSDLSPADINTVARRMGLAALG